MSDMPKKPNPENVRVGRRLERLRRARGFETIRAAAIALNINEDTWRAWERGDNEFPVAMARRLRELWSVSLDYIYCGAEVAMPKELLDRLRKAA